MLLGCLHPPSHFSGVTCPPAPSGMAVLPVGHSRLEPGCWLRDGSLPQKRKGIQVLSPPPWCLPASDLPYTRDLGQFPMRASALLTSLWGVSRLHFYFPGWRLEGLQLAQDLGSGPLSPQLCYLLH